MKQERLTIKTKNGFYELKKGKEFYGEENGIRLVHIIGKHEDIEEWFSKKRFYGKAENEPNKILELKFNRLDFRPEEDLLIIHFKVLNSWATDIFYNILSYGKTWALTEGELK